MCILLLIGLAALACGALPVFLGFVGAIYGAKAFTTSKEKQKDASYRQEDSQRPPIPSLFPETGAMIVRFKATKEFAVSYSLDFKTGEKCSLLYLYLKAIFLVEPAALTHEKAAPVTVRLWVVNRFGRVGLFGVSGFNHGFMVLVSQGRDRVGICARYPIANQAVSTATLSQHHRKYRCIRF